MLIQEMTKHFEIDPITHKVLINPKSVSVNRIARHFYGRSFNDLKPDQLPFVMEYIFFHYYNEIE